MHVLDTNITANVFRLTMYGHSSIDSTAAVVRRGLCCFNFTIMVELPLTTFGATGAFLPKFIFHLLKVALCGDLYTKHIVVSIYKM